MKIENGVYTGANGRESLIDLHVPEKIKCSDIVLFVHGYKGYKDWGCWNLVQQYFVDRGLGFAKMNTSHNGGTVDDPIDFPDLEAFAENRYSYELEDIKSAIQWVREKVQDTSVNIHLVGHSRGGGEVVLAGDHPEVKTVTTWAAISSIEDRFPSGEDLEEWREKGVRYMKNARTNQDMPHNFSMYQDWEQNKEKLSIQNAAKKLKKPCLHIHGDIDEAVSITNAEYISQWTEGKMIVIRDGNHTFGSSHPWNEDDLPPKLYEVCSLTRQFIEKNTES